MAGIICQALAGGAGTGRTREQLMVAAAERGARKDVRDAVCPLWAMPYARQLAVKREKVEEVRLIVLATSSNTY